MPGFDTAATIVSDVALECGLITSAIANPFTSTNQNVVQLVALLKPTGRELVKAHRWTDLQREGTFNTANGTASYALATVCTDFGRLIDDTTWNRAQDVSVPPVTPQHWQQSKAWTSAGVYKTMRLWGGAFHLDPTPTAVEAIYFEYISRNWGAAAFTKESPTADADVIQFDAHLFGRALKLRWLTAKGQNTVAAASDYEAALAFAKGQDGAAAVLRLGGSRRMPYPNIPETGFGT